MRINVIGLINSEKLILDSNLLDVWIRSGPRAKVELIVVIPLNILNNTHLTELSRSGIAIEDDEVDDSVQIDVIILNDFEAKTDLVAVFKWLVLLELHKESRLPVQLFPPESESAILIIKL